MTEIIPPRCPGPKRQRWRWAGWSPSLSTAFLRLFAMRVRIHIEQDCASIPDQAVGPACNHASPNNPREWIHPHPIEKARERQTHDDEQGDYRVGHDVDHSSTHVVVTARRSVGVFMLFEDDGIILLADPHMRRKTVRFGYLVDRFR